MSDENYFPPDDQASDDDARTVAFMLVQLDSLAATLSRLFEAPLDNATLTEHCEHLLALQQARRDLADLEQLIKNAIAALMGHKDEVIPDFGIVHRSPRKSRTQWDKDLKRVVLDTKLVNQETGEMIDESQVDKILAVWNLGAPRVTALRERDIDPDEWCTVETKPGWDIRIEAGT